MYVCIHVCIYVCVVVSYSFENNNMKTPLLLNKKKCTLMLICY